MKYIERLERASKVKKVLNSCTNKSQFDVARKYFELFSKRETDKCLRGFALGKYKSIWGLFEPGEVYY